MQNTKWNLYILYTGMFLVMAGFGVIIPILPFFARDLGASPLDMGLLVTLFALAQFIFAPIWGNYSDRLGRKKILVFSQAGYALSFFLMGMATSVSVLHLARVLGGLLSAATFPTAHAYIADFTSKEERTRSLGAMGAALNLGFILGPAAGGLLAPLGLKMTFFIAGTSILLTAAATALLLPESPRAARSVSSPQLPGPRAILVAINSPLALFFYLAFAVTFAGSSVFSMLSYYMMDKVDATPAHTAWAFTVMGATSAVVQGLFIGRVVDLLGEERTMAVALALGGLGYLSLSAAGSLTTVLASLIITSTAMALLRPTITSAISRATTLGQGLTLGVQSSFDSLGRIVGPLWAGLTYAYLVEAPYLSAALVFLASLVAVLFTHPSRREAASP